MQVSRRSVLKVLAAAAASTAVAALPAVARERKTAPAKAIGMLYDTTRCIGCKACVAACREANDLEADRSGIPGDLYQAPVDLNGRTKNVIKLYQDGEQQSFFKAQCMHCIDPGCASACMLHSLHKSEKTGVVEYDPRWCVGCRYCQMACPFNIPKFEFDKALPKIVKCELCRHRVKGEAVAGESGFTRYAKGEGPACCEVCPRQAVIYGSREELLAEAHRRIAENPHVYYQDRVYGEKELGGTQVLYLSHVPFAKLGLPEFGDRPSPDLAYTVQEGIYRGFVAPVVLYGALATVVMRNRKAEAKADAEKGGRS